MTRGKFPETFTCGSLEEIKQLIWVDWFYIHVQANFIVNFSDKSWQTTPSTYIAGYLLCMEDG